MISIMDDRFTLLIFIYVVLLPHQNNLNISKSKYACRNCCHKTKCYQHVFCWEILWKIFSTSQIEYKSNMSTYYSEVYQKTILFYISLHHDLSHHQPKYAQSFLFYDPITIYSLCSNFCTLVIMITR